MKYLRTFENFEIFDSEKRNFTTIRDMRFELRMSGIKNIGDYSDIEVVRLYNKTFDNDNIGIDREGNNIDILSDDIKKYNL